MSVFIQALHSLLEEGSYGKDKKSKVKLAFIGISNWALDPAKMNRGIFVQRDTPDETELLQIAKYLFQHIYYTRLGRSLHLADAHFIVFTITHLHQTKSHKNDIIRIILLHNIIHTPEYVFAKWLYLRAQTTL